jgi:hypothetical protein
LQERQVIAIINLLAQALVANRGANTQPYAINILQEQALIANPHLAGAIILLGVTLSRRLFAVY